MCAPDSTDSPTASASSWSAVSATCSGVWNRPGVDHLEPGVPEGPGDHLDAPIVAVEAGLGHDDSIGPLHGGDPKWMPIARSDPRRATIIGIAGVIVGVVTIAVVLLANNLGGDRSTTRSSQSKFHVGQPQSLARSIASGRAAVLQRHRHRLPPARGATPRRRSERRVDGLRRRHRVVCRDVGPPSADLHGLQRTPLCLRRRRPAPLSGVRDE